EALAIVPQVCEALQFAHEEGIVHRDVKPENILLDKKGRVKIADFGLAKLLDRPATVYTLTQAGQADIYSLGVVFYEMLTGELPLGRFDPPSQKVQVDVRLDKVVLHSLEKEPERRYQHASEVKSDVEIISAEPKAPVQYPPKASAPVKRRFSRAAIIGACWAPLFFLMLFPAALFFVSLQRSTSTSLGPSVSVPGVSIEVPGVSIESSGVSIEAPGDSNEVLGVSVPGVSVSAYGVPVDANVPVDVNVPVETPGVSVVMPGVSLSVPRVGLIGLVLILPFLLLGVSSVFGTTILGFVAISHIRHSAGRLYGMGLALFDALLFTLLALDAAIIAGCLVLSQNPAVQGTLIGLYPFSSGGRLVLLLFLAVALCIVVDFHIVRRAWRKANKGLVPIQPDSPFVVAGAIPATPRQEPERPYNPTGQVKSGPAVDSIQINRMETHVSIVSALRIGLGIMGVLIAIIVFAALVGGGRLSDDPKVMRITSIVGPAVSVFLIVVSVPGIICGVGLLKRRGWARILGLILAVPDLVTNIPIGPIIGIYTIWVLLNKETAQLFAHASSSTSKE
ncbi:MAG: protein kinase domain-containing protein, partial [Planctomycetota bacterium]